MNDKILSCVSHKIASFLARPKPSDSNDRISTPTDAYLCDPVGTGTYISEHFGPSAAFWSEQFGPCKKFIENPSWSNAKIIVISVFLTSDNMAVLFTPTLSL